MYPTANDAEQAFYEAFETGNLEVMMQVWAADETIACIHPLQRPLSGVDEIRTGWEQIFAGEPPMEFRVSRLHRTQSEDVAIHIVEENILVGKEREPHAPVLATNIYRREEDGWRLMLHHSSPAPRTTTPPLPDMSSRLH
ncbi:MAG: SgcJ/EcaC family oxidoreductase [Proteobacteria bacterium]|nr:MAG: SgcJ/EcaC family oxidoreductase [Pseudomonadota bacterium]QKK11596.1 MAG: nuclear transport factor 2 family protein [Pseudomonadota bacterium]